MKRLAIGLCCVLTAMLVLAGADRVSMSPAPQALRAPASLVRDAPTDSAAPAAAGTAADYKPRLEGFSASLEEIDLCYERDDCNFPRTDDHSYALAVGQALRAELLDLKAFAETNQIQDSAVTDIANFYLKVEDGYVQEAALAILATQPPQAESLDAILSHVIGGYDAPLIQQAMRELERYQNNDDRAKIAVALASGMTTGSPFVAKEISAGIFPFVAYASLPVFSEAAAELPDGSMVKANLERSLREFRENR